LKALPAEKLAATGMGEKLSMAVAYLLQQQYAFLKEHETARFFSGLEAPKDGEPEVAEVKASAIEILAFEEYILMTYGEAPLQLKNIEEEKRLILTEMFKDPASAFKKLEEEYKESPLFTELGTKIMQASLEKGKGDNLSEWWTVISTTVNEKNKLVPLDIPAEWDKWEETDKLRLSGIPNYLLKNMSCKGTSRKIAEDVDEALEIVARKIPAYYRRNKDLKIKRPIIKHNLTWKAQMELLLGVECYEKKMVKMSELVSIKRNYGLDKDFAIIDSDKIIPQERKEARRKERQDAIATFDRERLTNDDGSKKERPTTPLGRYDPLEEHVIEEYEEAFQHFARAAVIAERAKAWVMMQNACRYILTLAHKVFYSPSDAADSAKTWRAKIEREMEIIERERRPDALQQMSSLQEQRDKIKDVEERLKPLKAESQLIYRRCPAGCIQTACECLLAYLEQMKDSMASQELTEEEREAMGSDSSEEESDPWFFSRPEIDIQGVLKLIYFTIEMEYDGGRDRTCCDLGLMLNRVTDNKFAERVLGFMQKASLRRSLHEQLDDLMDQWKNIKRDKPLADELIDASRRELQHFMTLNPTMNKLKTAGGKLGMKFGGSTSIAGLISKENHGALIEAAKPSEKEEARRDVVIESYEKTITILRQKKETFLVAQACSELGNFLYFINQKDKAAVLWKDGIDAVLRTMDSLKHFRSVFDRTSNMLEAFGFWGCIVASMLLTRNAYLTYSADLHLRSEACAMAVSLITATFTCSLPHPQRNCDFKDNQPRESWPGLFPLDLFASPWVIYPVVLMESLEYMNHGAIRSKLYIEALPTLSMYEFASTELTKDVFGSILSRILKAECCIESGFLYEAISLFFGLLRTKGLPNPSLRSEFQELKIENVEEVDGIRFYNGVVLEDPRNLKAVGTVLRSGLPGCITDDELCQRLDPQERKYIRYRYCLAVSRMLYRLGTMEKLLATEEEAAATEVDKGAGESFLKGGGIKIESSNPLSYLDEAESIMLALQKECVGVQEDGKAYEVDDLSWGGRNPEGDEAFVRASLLRCNIEEYRGNYKEASDLMEKCLCLMEEVPAPHVPPIIYDSSVPMGGDTDVGKARRHWRTQLDVQLWLKCRIRLCHIYFSQGKYDACEQQCAVGMREAADVNEKRLSREIALVHAQVLVLTGKPQDAIAMFDALVNSTRELRMADNVYVEALLNYGDVKVEMGKTDAAISLYEEAASVVYDMIETHGLDMSVLCQQPPQMDYVPVRVLGVRPEDAEPLDKDAMLEPGTMNTDTVAWEELENLFIPCMELFVDVSLKQAQCYAEKGRLNSALKVLCLARQVMLRTCNPMPHNIAAINLLLGRLHTQLIWERGVFDGGAWAKFDKIVGGPGAEVEIEPGFDLVKSFDFASLCLKESLRIGTESASHNRNILRVALVDLIRLHGMGAIMTNAPPAPTDPDAPPAEEHDSKKFLLRNSGFASSYLHEAMSLSQMQESLFNDTVSLLDKPVIDGSEIPKVIVSGLQDAEKFFGDSRVNRPEEGAPATVGALSVLMYHLTMSKEQGMAGLSHFRRTERWASKLHRQLKKMFPKYNEACCYTPLDTEPDPEPLEAGSIRVQWAEYPFAESEEESPLHADGSRPSSGASRVVQKFRDDTVTLKDLPTTMIYSLARPPPQDGDSGEANPHAVTGMIEVGVDVVEELVKELREVQYLVSTHKRDAASEPINEVLEAQIKAALVNVKNFFSASGQGGDDLKLPEDTDVSEWIPHLVKMFRRQLGLELVDEVLWKWLLQCLVERDGNLQVMANSP